MAVSKLCAQLTEEFEMEILVSLFHCFIFSFFHFPKLLLLLAGLQPILSFSSRLDSSAKRSVLLMSNQLRFFDNLSSNMRPQGQCIFVATSSALLASATPFIGERCIPLATCESSPSPSSWSDSSSILLPKCDHNTDTDTVSVSYVSPSASPYHAYEAQRLQIDNTSSSMIQTPTKRAHAAKAQAATMAQSAKARGRPRLDKCEKHRREKKRCPSNCPWKDQSVALSSSSSSNNNNNNNKQHNCKRQRLSSLSDDAETDESTDASKRPRLTFADVVAAMPTPAHDDNARLEVPWSNATLTASTSAAGGGEFAVVPASSSSWDLDAASNYNDSVSVTEFHLDPSSPLNMDFFFELPSPVETDCPLDTSSDLEFLRPSVDLCPSFDGVAELPFVLESACSQLFDLAPAASTVNVNLQDATLPCFATDSYFVDFTAFDSSVSSPL